MYLASFPGLGRGLDFLLPSFLVSRQEKKVEARWIRPTEYHFNDDECAKRDTFSRYNDLIIWKRITFLGYSFHRWNVCGAYAIRPYRVTGKRIDFLRSNVGAYCIRPTGRHPKDGKCGKRIAFLRYNDLIIWKRITFLGYSFHRWNVCGAYAIRPYRVTGKRIDFLRSNVGAYCIRPTGRHPKDGKCGKRIAFLRYKDLITRKRITFLGYSFHKWNVCGAYAIRPYRVTRKRVDFLRSHIVAYCIRPIRCHSKDGECTKRVNFSGYNNHTIQKRTTFWIFIFDEWWKRGSFSGYNNHIIRKRITFSGYIDLVV